MHADELRHIQQRHDGVPPAGWYTGPLEFQKAAVIAAAAWHDIKDDSDPELPACDATHRTNCIGIVESIMAGNEPDDSPFAQAAYRRWLEVKPTAEPPKEALHQ